MKIGELIRIRRIELGLTQEQLALRVGYTCRSSIEKVELGKNDVKQRMIPKYAEALGVPITYLLGVDDKPITSGEAELIYAYRRADAETQHVIRRLLKGVD